MGQVDLSGAVDRVPNGRGIRITLYVALPVARAVSQGALASIASVPLNVADGKRYNSLQTTSGFTVPTPKNPIGFAGNGPPVSKAGRHSMNVYLYYDSQQPHAYMKILSHPRFWRVAALLAVDGLLFGLTDPRQVPSFTLIVAVLLLVVTVYQLMLALLLAADWYGLPGKAHRRRQARILTGVAGGLIVLQSIGQLGTRDIVVAVPLALIVYLYISYGKGKGAGREAARKPTVSLAVAE